MNKALIVILALLILLHSASLMGSTPPEMPEVGLIEGLEMVPLVDGAPSGGGQSTQGGENETIMMPDF